MGATSDPKVVLDAGALIALERADPRMRALCRHALKERVELVIPAGVVGQVFRDRARQVALGLLIRSPSTTVPALDRELAEAAGILCGHSGTADVVDASVVLTARRERAVVVTSDGKDLLRLDPTLKVERI